jgi:hypothetical protein
MQKGKRDTSGLKVVSRREIKGMVITTFLFSVTGDATVERLNYLTETYYTRDEFAGIDWRERFKKGEYEYTRRTETKQKFLCVGGPLAGQRVTEAPDYSAYNAANFNRGRNKQTEYRVVFVHDSLLKGKA